MENNTNNLWTKKFKDMTPEEKKKAEKVYNYASSLLRYYSEFNMAKKNSNFIKKGWYKNMFFLRRTPEDIINYVGVSHNDLLKAAKEYQDNNGADTEFTKDFEQRIQELKQKMKNNPNKIKLIWKILIAIIFLIALILYFNSDAEPSGTYNNQLTGTSGLIKDLPKDDMIYLIAKSNSTLQNGLINISIIDRVETRDDITDFNAIIDTNTNSYTFEYTVEIAKSILSDIPKNFNYGTIIIILRNPDVSKDIQIMHFRVPKEKLLKTDWDNASIEIFEQTVEEYMPFIKPR